MTGKEFFIAALVYGACNRIEPRAGGRGGLGRREGAPVDGGDRMTASELMDVLDSIPAARRQARPPRALDH